MVIVQNWKIPELSGDAVRKIYIYLPDSYETEGKRHYPVMYMFDGQNVFFDEDATYGKSWGMEKYMQASGRQMMIVAVESSHNGRLEEYAPFGFSVKDLGDFRGRGKAYMDWLTGTLKPYIDKNYRTMPEKEHTILCGSSMGGLMALYGVTSFNHVFLHAACLSASVWIDPDSVLKMIDSSLLASGTCICIAYGSEELSNHMQTEQALLDTVSHLEERGALVNFQIIPGGTHCEAAWERQIPFFMDTVAGPCPATYKMRRKV